MNAQNRIISHELDVIKIVEGVEVVIHAMDTDAVYYSIIQPDTPQMMKRAKNNNGTFRIPSIGEMSVLTLWGSLEEV